jgi:hypothetical protein
MCCIVVTSEIRPARRADVTTTSQARVSRRGRGRVASHVKKGATASDIENEHRGELEQRREV